MPPSSSAPSGGSIRGSRQARHSSTSPTHPNGPLLFATLNVRSAVNKAAEIHDLISSYNLDLLLLCETWIPSDAPSPAVKQDIAPNGYSVLHSHRKSTINRGKTVGRIKGGGGLAVIYRHGLTLSDLTMGSYSTFEKLGVKVSSGSRSVNFIGIYRPSPLLFLPLPSSTTFLFHSKPSNP